LERIGTLGNSRYRLSDLQLFAGMDHAQLAPLLGGCPIVRLARGTRLQEPSGCMFVLLSGALDVAEDATAPDAGSMRILPGESVGEQAVLDESAGWLNLTALEDSDLLLLEAPLVWTLIEHANGLARNLLRLLSFRVRAAKAALRTRRKLGEFYRQLSLNDSLTGLYNRAWLNDMLPRIAATAQRTGAPLSLVMVDLDHFKRFNDDHGHLLGDQALRAAAGVIGSGLRPSDYAVRFGGEEMMVVLPDTGTQAAVVVAERLCERMRLARVFTEGDTRLPHLTASFGVATLEPGMSEQDLVAHADAALYRAKQAGRDRVAL
jgi:diguanylate cyclase (GGDEF)-like protein